MVKILAHAKLNLHLRIIGTLPDGYHALETVMQTISLSDQLCITPNQTGRISFTCNDSALNGPENLVIKASNLFLRATGLSDGFDIYLTKQIPVAAGLGGGSSDAAAALTALNHYYHMPITTSALEEIGLQLGADVPFFIRGGCSLAENKGEILTPLKKTKKYAYVIVKHGEKPSTGAMYAALDAVGYTTNAQPLDFCRLANDAAYLRAYAANDFVSVSPFDRQLQTDFLACGAERIYLSGSGPTCFAVFDNSAAAGAVFEKMRKKYPLCFLADDTESGSLLV
ncbi:MAG: 4-(cytidine 5'-diphospho)-2-C-methyl-D-erythritol kinase [Clostridia bacterium]|nr:4-(cytidine 5'-diphospho)-2-C-methyl-D-erythritol kinase [Clostridia bacterium]MBQ7289172.1 4-(cytidine 5'-diphospho)-2-C-methyl-D-erythritol kinase [Clostridia bacterium]